MDKDELNGVGMSWFYCHLLTVFTNSKQIQDGGRACARTLYTTHNILPFNGKDNVLYLSIIVIAYSKFTYSLWNSPGTLLSLYEIYLKN